MVQCDYFRFVWRGAQWSNMTSCELYGGGADVELFKTYNWVKKMISCQLRPLVVILFLGKDFTLEKFIEKRNVS